MVEQFGFYVKNNSNCKGIPFTSFEKISKEWTGKEFNLPFYDNRTKRICRVVGWNDLLFGSPCLVHVCKVRSETGEEGYLIYGGNCGVRIYDKNKEWGQPIIWVANIEDLPPKVRKIVAKLDA